MCFLLHRVNFYIQTNLTRYVNFWTSRDNDNLSQRMVVTQEIDCEGST